MINIVTTRFNSTTYEENVNYKKRKGLNGCIYGVPYELNDKIKPNSITAVFEMNNTTNKIEGIGIIRNKPCELHCQIYKDNNVNRYVYKSKYHINRDTLMQNQSHAKLIEQIEKVVFKGYTHLKRGSGFTTITKKILDIHNINENELHETIYALCIQYVNTYKRNEIYLHMEKLFAKLNYNTSNISKPHLSTNAHIRLG